MRDDAAMRAARKVVAYLDDGLNRATGLKPDPEWNTVVIAEVARIIRETMQEERR